MFQFSIDVNYLEVRFLKGCKFNQTFQHTLSYNMFSSPFRAAVQAMSTDELRTKNDLSEAQRAEELLQAATASTGTIDYSGSARSSATRLQYSTPVTICEERLDLVTYRINLIV